MTNDDGRHVALPKLFGAPAYARPVVPVETADRPFDPDDMPIEAERTEEEQELVRVLASRPYAPPTQPIEPAAREGAPMLRARPFRLGAITGRFRPPGARDR